MLDKFLMIVMTQKEDESVVILRGKKHQNITETNIAQCTLHVEEKVRISIDRIETVST